MAAVLLALGAALAYAAASVLQQREAEADAASDQGSAVGGGFRLVVRLAHRPVWLAGLGAYYGLVVRPRLRRPAETGPTTPETP